jgi:hypothetical protein
VVGGLAGAAIGSQVAGSTRYHGGGSTGGALIGGAIGAVLGSQVAKGSC